eukprot:Lithocolla_globosa_v1_NODE_540_length_3787_cov_70.867631.p4 type:complete len:193 gc:universal NODE_540_length_3787_cov_70.867631:2389-1811(-)
MMLGAIAEKKETTDVTQKFLSEMYIRLMGRLIILIPNSMKQLDILCIPAGGTSDHKDSWPRGGNTEGGDYRDHLSGVLTNTDDPTQPGWSSFKVAFDTPRKTLPAIFSAFRLASPIGGLIRLPPIADNNFFKSLASINLNSYKLHHVDPLHLVKITKSVMEGRCFVTAAMDLRIQSTIRECIFSLFSTFSMT